MINLQLIVNLSAKLVILFGKCIACYALTIPIFAIFATRQEYKIWKVTAEPLTLWGLLKVYCFNISWMGITLLQSLSLLPMWASRGFGNSVEIEAHCVMEKLAAMVLVHLFLGEVIIVNEENLPFVNRIPQPIHSSKPDKFHVAPVFIANHGSQLDCAAIYYIHRRFKWIAKQSVRFIPGPGNLMSLANHIFIQRSGRNSQSKSSLYTQSNDAVQHGVPMLVFPQGTRKIQQNIPFKDGAFNIAIQNESLLVPISIAIPLNIWNLSYFTNSDDDKSKTAITITVHEPIQTSKDSDKVLLKQKCHETIYSALPLHYKSNPIPTYQQPASKATTDNTSASTDAKKIQ